MNAAPLDPGPQATAPVKRFAFKGRVSTEDNQDPEASRNWQISRSRALIEPVGGIIVAEYFDIGQSRSLPWARRPQAAELLADLANPDRGFDAVVIGEPQRAFYGNQYSLTMPVFTHYGVELWVPEVGGPIDPDSEAHDLIMSVFGGMSKGERNRIRLRVRAAMAAQAAVEGRFLGGRPPYGYRIADAGPHPNPAKAADGKRLHKLEPDPQTARVVRRIFREYLGGRGLFAIAEGLTRDGSPPRPSTTRPATRTAPAKAGPRAPSAPSCASPATPAGRSGTSSARTRSCSTSTTSPADMRPGCAGTTPGSGSGPTPSPRSPWSRSRTSRPPRPSWPARAAPGRPATRPASE
jgi:DNA invertase Pin-like site-specific DNA recombinase